MPEKISVAEAKAKLSALLGEVAYGKKRFIIERRGKPVAALVSVQDLEHLERSQSTPAKPHWALALVGAWGELIVVTGNVRHFQRVPGLTVENWLE